jgi:peptidoglycan-associated lipoprotein
MNATKAGALWFCAATLLAGCSNTPTNPTADAPAPVAQRSSTPAASAAPKAAAASAVATVALPEYLDPRSPIAAKRSVYFDFDDFSVKPEYTSLIERHGKYLSSHPALAIKIEGYADERGSAEYNLALGQKRAQSVLSALKSTASRMRRWRPSAGARSDPLLPDTTRPPGRKTGVPTWPTRPSSPKRVA